MAEPIRCSHGNLYRVTVDGQVYEISAPTKGEARACLKGLRGKPLPPGVDLVLVPRPTEE